MSWFGLVPFWECLGKGGKRKLVKRVRWILREGLKWFFYIHIELLSIKTVDRNEKLWFCVGIMMKRKIVHSILKN